MRLLQQPGSFFVLLTFQQLALGFPAEQSGFAAMDELHARTGAPIPKNLAALRDLPVRHTDCVDRTDMLEYVREKAKR